jgi:hypothetical protein
MLNVNIKFNLNALNTFEYETRRQARQRARNNRFKIINLFLCHWIH